MVKSIVVMIAIVFAVTQQPARDARGEARGTGSLAGSVTTNDLSPRPLRLARVTVTGGSLVSPRIAITDDNGRFVVDGLPAGQYSLAADKPAYLKMNYGASRPSRQGTSVVLADGQQRSGITIRLPHGAAITGAVTNAAGEPVPDAYVTAIGWQFYGGVRTLLPRNEGPTDDRGEYRIYGLTAGEYLVSVAPPDGPRGPSDLIQIVEGEVDRALATAQQAAGGNQSPLRPRLVGSAPIFYPGTAMAAGATRIVLKDGEEQAGVDIRMQLVPMSRIDGTVLNPDGSPSSTAEVTLTSVDAPAPNEAFAYGGRLGPRRADPQGRFSFAGVPPGEYLLTASTQPRGGGGRIGPPAAADPLMAFATVSINGDDRVEALTLQRGMAVTGRFAFEGGAPPAQLTGARVTLRGLRVDQSRTINIFTADAQADGTFNLTGLTPGRFVFEVNAPASGASTPAWAVQSVVAGGRDLLDAPLELQPGERLSDVVVTFTNTPTLVSGVLQNTSGAPTSDYFIVIFSEDSRFWFPNSRRVVSVRPDTRGAYHVPNLPPGAYFISAVTDVETDEWFDPDFLSALAAASPVRITLGAGEQKHQDLRISR